MLDKLVLDVEEDLREEFKKVDKLVYENSKKVLSAFHKYNIQNGDFHGTTGYGYGDIGRDKIEKIYADIFNTESALVRTQFVCGTHALTVALFGILRPGDNLLTITGLPYDTLHSVIGINDNPSGLISFGVNYKYIDLKDGDFDYTKIKKELKNVKMVHIQRSIGYANRSTLSTEKVNKVVNFIRQINEDICILVDNSYCEMCFKNEPNGDLVVGSLIKNLGAGIVNNGAYICGKEKYVKLCAERLTSPGLGAEVGSTLGQNKSFLMGLYMAPSVVGNALKVKLFTREVFKRLGYDCINTDLNDIVLGIVFKNKFELITYVREIQACSAIDSAFIPEPNSMPGYENDIIMASGSFTDGSSIELSCDAPLRDPYVVYQQGSLTYEYGKIAVINAIKPFANK